MHSWHSFGFTVKYLIGLASTVRVHSLSKMEAVALTLTTAVLGQNTAGWPTSHTLDAQPGWSWSAGTSLHKVSNLGPSTHTHAWLSKLTSREQRRSLIGSRIHCARERERGTGEKGNGEMRHNITYHYHYYHFLPVQGNHRYSIVLDRVPPAGIVAVSIPWRRHDQNPEVIIYRARSSTACEYTAL